MTAAALKSAIALALTAIALPMLADEPATEAQIANQLSAREREEYRARVDQAGTDAERRQIQNEYREMAEERARLERGAGTGNTQGATSQMKRHGQADPGADVKTGPYGSKTKPRKQGK